MKKGYVFIIIIVFLLSFGLFTRYDKDRINSVLDKHEDITASIESIKNYYPDTVVDISQDEIEKNGGETVVSYTYVLEAQREEILLNALYEVTALDTLPHLKQIYYYWQNKDDGKKVYEDEKCTFYMLEKDINDESSFVLIGEYRTNDLSIYINSIIPSEEVLQNLPNDVEVLNKVFK